MGKAFDDIIAAYGRMLNWVLDRSAATLVVFLASVDCDFTHRNYSPCAGRYARAFMGLSEGWLANGQSEPTADDVLAHIDEISATEKFIVPDSIVDEVLEVCDRLGISAMPDDAEVSFPEPTKQ